MNIYQKLYSTGLINTGHSNKFTMVDLHVTCLAIFLQYLSSSSISSFSTPPLTAFSFSCSVFWWIFCLCSSNTAAIPSLERISTVVTWSVWLQQSEVAFFTAFRVWSSLDCHSFSSSWISSCLNCFHMRRKIFK